MLVKIYFETLPEWAANDFLKENVYCVGDNYICDEETADRLSKKYNFETEEVEAIDIVDIIESEREVYDNFSFKSFLKTQELEEQKDFEKAYEIFENSIPLFEEFYNSSNESWTDIYMNDEGHEYAVYGDGNINGCNEFIVFKIK